MNDNPLSHSSLYLVGETKSGASRKITAFHKPLIRRRKSAGQVHAEPIFVTGNKGFLRPDCALTDRARAMKVTRKLIESLDARQAEYFVWDETMPGFGVRVQPSGRKVFIVRYRTVAGTQRKYTIGRCDTMTPDQARDRARAVFVDVADGKDPASDRQSKRDGATVADLWASWKANREGHWKASTAVTIGILWDHHIVPHIGNKLVADLSEADCIELHDKLGMDRKVNANRALQALRAGLNHAERVKWRPRHSNPIAEEFQWFPETERTVFLRLPQIKALFAVLDAPDCPGRWALPWLIKLLLLTGARRNEIAKARWDWLDTELGTLTMPDSKTGKKTIHLSDAALIMMERVRAEQRRRNRPDCLWIIPNASMEGPLTSLHHDWKEIVKRAGMPDLHMHDLRHTVGSIGHQSGLSQKEVADLLGHRNLRTTERYIHSYDPAKRAAANRAVAGIAALMD